MSFDTQMVSGALTVIFLRRYYLFIIFSGRYISAHDYEDF
jgi:hypothetical protein